MRIAVYLFGDPSHDGRVLREAASLTGAGHEVTLLVRYHPDQRAQSTSIPPGVTVIDVQPPAGSWFLANAIRRPWRLGRWVWVSWLGARRLKPAAIARAAWATLLAPWVAAGMVWYRLRRPGDRVDDGILDYLLYWQASILPWCRAAAVAAPPADVHHAHDLSALPAAMAAARRDGRVIYDSHEVFLESGRHARRPRWVRRWLRRWERRMVSGVDAVVTVNPGVAEVLERRLAPRRLVVVYNCQPVREPHEAPSLSVRSRLGLAPDVPIALYHGGLSRHRGLDVLAAAVHEPGMEAVHVVFMGYGSERPLVERLAADPTSGGRVHVLDAVAPDEVVDAVSGADVAVMPIGASTLNHVLSTPNKLFEALAAGVPVVVSDFPEMRRIVRDDPSGPLGETCDPALPASVAAAILRVLDLPAAESTALRARCRNAAATRWNWDVEVGKLLRLYDDLDAEARSTA